MRPPATAVVVFVTSFFAFTLLPGCLYGPRNGQSSASKSAPILFVGWWFFPSDEVRFFAQNGAGGWDQIPHAPVYTIDTAYRDGAGTDWYRFSAPDVVIPTSYWSASASRVNVAHVKATVGGVPLHTFDVDADGCINSAFPLGGNNVINSCQSTQSPVAAINASCGALDGDCCLGGASCDAGKQCRHDKCVNPCGQLNQTCCAEAPACDALDTVCSGGVCRACGALGQQCCSYGCRTNNGTCSNGTCQCGAVNQPCCANHACGAGTICLNDNRCQLCGGLNQICCANNTCSNGTCVPSSPLPTCQCGYLNQKCCPGSVCNAGYQCMGGMCGDGNTPPPQCVAPGGPCGTSTGPFCCAGSLCDFGTCKACIAHGQLCGPGRGELCCSFGDQCVLDQASETELCNIPN